MAQIDPAALFDSTDEIIPSRCTACRPDHAAKLAELLDYLVESQRSVTISHIHRAIQRPPPEGSGYPMGQSALRLHLASHDADRFNAINFRGRG